MSKNRKRKSPQERWEVWDRYIGEENAVGACTACERPLRFRDMVVGHDVALTKEGPDTIANMRPLCRRCDEGMGTDSIDEYRQRLHGPATAPQAELPTTPVSELEEGLANLGITTFQPPVRGALAFIEPVKDGHCYIEGTSNHPDVSFHNGNSRWCSRCQNLHCAKHSISAEGRRYCMVYWMIGQAIQAEQSSAPSGPRKVWNYLRK